MFRYGTKIIVILLLCSVLIVTSLPVYAQDEIEEPAEIVARIDITGNKIPAIKVSDWTAINITVTDAFGINWSYLSSSFPLMSRYYWPIRHPSWRPFLGYSSLRFEPEIVEGDPRGWYTKVTPSAIAEADQGRTYDLKLEVQTDDIAVDYAVVVGIKTTRINVFGQEVGVSYIYVPVKSSALNNIKMETSVTEKEGGPHSYVHFEVTVKNLGYYKDMFRLEFEEESGLTVAATKQLIVLNPDESKSVGIDVLTPEKFYDPGTPYPIKILAASSGDPIPTHIGTIVVITKGIYIPILAGIIAVPIIIILAILYLLFYYYRERKERRIFGKPEKPWTIPEEKRHLEELKQKNKEEYDKERQMMQDEYKSAMLWFNNYRDAERQRGKKEISESKQGGISGKIFKKKEKDEKSDKKTIDEKKQKKETGGKITQFLKKPKKKNNKNKLTKAISLPKKQKPKKPVKKKKVEEPKDVNKIQVQEMQKISEEQRRKEKLLLQIKRDQDKQKRMIK